MIGVIAESSDDMAVREFFELFKTPWEFHRPGHHYDVVLCASTNPIEQTGARLVLVYAGRPLPSDLPAGVQVGAQCRATRILSYDGHKVPIYGESLTFQQSAVHTLVDPICEQSAIYSYEDGGTTIARIGYDLFEEVRILLTKGQPAIYSDSPTLDLHIAVLRDLMIARGARLDEIPPVPRGYKFIACLTHDVDHPSIRLHKLDHTMFGFVYRAVVGSVLDACRGKLPWRKVGVNWMAVLKLPLAHLGLVDDFWYHLDAYKKLEKGLPSSYFLIPTKGYSGKTRIGIAPKRRASSYAASDIADRARELASTGSEIGTHGIDAWLDSAKAKQELDDTSKATGVPAHGIRMHWLYFDEQSPKMLDEAGAEYDSSVGYNETVGYRSGTAQAYMPFGCTQMLELPLHIMDTALFFPSYLDLSAADASKRVSSIIDNAVRSGGCVTVNWHDRSIAPERLWGDSYLQLVEELREKGAWFATCSEAVSWFRARRSASIAESNGETRINSGVTAEEGHRVPGLQLRTHRNQVPHIGLQFACSGAAS